MSDLEPGVILSPDTIAAMERLEIPPLQRLDMLHPADFTIEWSQCPCDCISDVAAATQMRDLGEQGLAAMSRGGPARRPEKEDQP